MPTTYALNTPGNRLFPSRIAEVGLKQLRESKTLSQSALAARLKAPQSYVSKYETGERRLDFVETEEVCKALGISLADFAEILEANKPSRRTKQKKAAKRGGGL